MAKKYGITGFGYPKFVKSLKRFEDDYIDAVREVVIETAYMLYSDMRAMAPVGMIDGGNLRQSIDMTFKNKGLTAVITVGAHYAIYVEMGTGIYAEEGNGRKTPWIYYSEELGRYVFTRGMKAQPFFRPSYERALKYFKTEMKKLG